MANEILDRNPQLLRPAAEGAMMNADAAAAPYLAAANLGGAVAGLGGKGFDIAMQIQDRKNQGELSELRLKMRQHRAEWERDVMPQLEPEARLEAWEQEADRFSSQVSQREMAPAVRSMFEQTYRDFRGSTSLEIQANAYAEMDRAAVESLTREAEYLYNSGQPDEGAKVLDQMPLPAWKREAAKADMAQQYEFDSMMGAAIEGVLDDSQEKPGWMAPDDFARIKRTQEASSARNADLITEAILADENIQNEAALDRELEKYKEDLSPAQLKGIRDAFKVRVPMVDEEWSNWIDDINELKELRGQMSPEEYQKAYYEKSMRLKANRRREGYTDLMQILQSHHPDTLAAAKENLMKDKRTMLRDLAGVDFGKKLDAVLMTDIDETDARAIRGRAEIFFKDIVGTATTDQLEDNAWIEWAKGEAWGRAQGKRPKTFQGQPAKSFVPNTGPASPTDVAFPGSSSNEERRYRRGGGSPYGELLPKKGELKR